MEKDCCESYSDRTELTKHVRKFHPDSKYDCPEPHCGYTTVVKSRMERCELQAASS